MSKTWWCRQMNHISHSSSLYNFWLSYLFDNFQLYLSWLLSTKVQGSSLLEATSPWTPSCGQESDLRRICRDLPSNWGGVWIRSSLSLSQVQDRNVDYYGQIGRSAVAQLSDRNSQYYSGEWKLVSGYNFSHKLNRTCPEIELFSRCLLKYWKLRWQPEDN